MLAMAAMRGVINRTQIRLLLAHSTLTKCRCEVIAIKELTLKCHRCADATRQPQIVALAFLPFTGAVRRPHTTTTLAQLWRARRSAEALQVRYTGELQILG